MLCVYKFVIRLRTFLIKKSALWENKCLMNLSTGNQPSEETYRNLELCLICLKTFTCLVLKCSYHLNIEPNKKNYISTITRKTIWILVQFSKGVCLRPPLPMVKKGSLTRARTLTMVTNGGQDRSAHMVVVVKKANLTWQCESLKISIQLRFSKLN